MKKLTAVLLGMTLMFGGCATNQNDLEQQVGQLQARVSSMEENVEYLCALVGETSTMGMIVYLGDRKFLNQLTGEVVPYDALVLECLEAVEFYKEDVQKRKLAKEKKNMEETTDEVTETPDVLVE